MTISADDYRVVDSQVLVDHPRVRITMDTLEYNGQRRAHLILGGGIAARAAIAAVALTPDRQLVLTRQYRHALRAVIYDLPAGRLDPDEEPIEGARRELEEETGYRPGRIIHLGKFYQFPSTIDVPTHLFFADGLTAARQHLDEGEELEVVLMPVPEVLATIKRGEVVDGSLQLGVLLAQHKGLLPEG
jgi:ADP-ribose pyrophosphatase